MKPAARRATVSRPYVIYLVSLGVCAAILTALCWRPFHTPSTASLAPPPGTHLQGLFSISPDESEVACPIADRDGVSLWLLPIFRRGMHKLAGTQGARLPFWSPDGRSIGFFTSRELKTVNIADGSVRSICSVTKAMGGAWEDENAIVFAPSDEGPIYRVDLRSGTQEPVTQLNPALDESSHRWPQFLPDGRLLYSTFSRGSSEGDLYLTTPNGSRRQFLLRVPGRVVYRPASGGYLVYSRDGRLLSQGFDPVHSRITGQPRLVVPFTGYSSSDGARLFAAGRSRIIYQNADPDRVRQLIWMDRDHQRCNPIGEPARYSLPRVSPDGRTILVARADAGGNSRLWILDALTGAARVLTPGRTKVSHPAWSPNGKEYLFTMLESRHLAISKAPLDQMAPSEMLVSGDASVYPLDWNGSLNLMLYMLERDDRYEIWGASPPKGKPVTIVKLGTEGPRDGKISADGKWIAFTARPSKASTYDVYVTPFSRQAGAIVTLADCYRVSSGGGFEPEWNPAGAELAYVNAGRQLVSVDVRLGSGFYAGSPHVLFSLSGSETDPLDYEPGFGYSVSPDGRRFILAMRTAEPENELTVRRW
jgi:eukaryotic-like serine/threonine-protein kinase